MLNITSLDDLSYISTNGQNITDASRAFTGLTEYSMEDLHNISLEDIFNMLRIGPDFDCHNINGSQEYLIFTKTHDVRVVNIYVIEQMDKMVYIFTEIPDSRLEDNFMYLCQLCDENINAVGIYSVPDFTLLKANQSYLEFFQYPNNMLENAIGRQVWNLVARWKNTPAERLWLNVINSGKTQRVRECMRKSSTGEITYWDGLLTPVKKNGEVRYIVTNARDVTDKVSIKEQLEEKSRIIESQKQKLELFIEEMSDALVLLDRDNNFTMLNRAAREFFYNPDEVQKNGDSFTHTNYYDRQGKKLAIDDMPGTRILRGEKVEQFEMKVVRPDKTVFYSVSGRSICNEKEEIEYALLCIHNITEKVSYENEIKKQRDKLEAIIENMSDGLSIFDHEGKYIMINKAAREMFFPSHNYMGQAGDGYYQAEYFDEDGNRIPYKKIPSIRVKEGESFTNMIINLRFPNKALHINVSGAPVYDENGKLIMGVLCSRDISETIEYREKLLKIEYEKNQALEKTIEMKDEFLSIISHEFRTPLNVINTAVQALNYFCNGELSERARNYINTIRQNTFRQLRLVNNLLDITRANAGRIKVHRKNIDIVFLTRAITESVYSFAGQKGVNIVFQSSFETEIIGIDDEKYERILLNLLSNAIKFTPSGKSIIVKLYEYKDNICVEVKDDGIGIPKDKLNLIFERFGQVDSSLSRQAEGTGIGLSLVKKFVEALDGSISVSSELGRGTSFTISLPNILFHEDNDEIGMIDLIDNRLIQITDVEFSDIYV